MLLVKITSTWIHFIRQVWTGKSIFQETKVHVILHILKVRNSVWIHNRVLPSRFCRCFLSAMGKQNVICSICSHFCFKESHDCSCCWDGAAVRIPVSVPFWPTSAILSIGFCLTPYTHSAHSKSHTEQQLLSFGQNIKSVKDFECMKCSSIDLFICLLFLLFKDPLHYLL